MNNRKPVFTARIISIILFAMTLMIICASVAQASQFTPVLIGKTEDTTFRMSLISAELKIKCNKQRISFDWLLTYHNPMNIWIEGELSMPMLKNQLITAFDMNIGEILRKGMIAEKQNAKQTYEQIVGRNNDPGLLEIVKGNSIKLRVFPIKENENKQIRISYECDYDFEKGIFSLNYPFDFVDNIQYFNIDVDCSEAGLPFFIESNISELKIDNSGKSSVQLNDFNGSNYFKFMYRESLDKPLLNISEFRNERYFSALVKVPDKKLKPQKINSVTLLVDASYSQRNNDFKAQKYFIKEYLKRNGNLKIEVIVFSLYELDRRNFTIKSGKSDELISYLDSIKYIGATNYGSINLTNNNSDIIIMLSNGVKNIGDFDFPALNKPIYFVNSNPDFDENYIRNITDKSGGKFVNLYKNDNLYSTLGTMFDNRPSIKSIESNNKTSEILVSKFLEKPDIYRISGKLESNNDLITVLFTDGTKTILDFSNEKANIDSSIPRVWASEKVNSLILKSSIDTSQIVSLSKKHSFATKLTSFIVLERTEQYYSYKIEPPPDLVKDFISLKKLYDGYIELEKKYEIEEKERFIKYHTEGVNRYLNILKFNYYDYYQDIYEYLNKNNNLYNTGWTFNLLESDLIDMGKTGIIIPQAFFHENNKFKILDSLYFLKNDVVIDISKSFIKENIDSEINSIKVKLLNNDSLTFPCNLIKGRLNVVDIDIFKEFRQRGLGFGDLNISIKDSNDKMLDSFYVIVNSNYSELVTKNDNTFENLLSGKNHFYIYNDYGNICEFEEEIHQGIENKIEKKIFKINPFLEFTQIDTNSNGTGSIEGFVRDDNGMGLRGASVFLEGTQRGAAVREFNGRFIVTGITPGDYTVRFSFIGRKAVRRKVRIDTNRRTFLNVKLNEYVGVTSSIMLYAEKNESDFQSIDLSYETTKESSDLIYKKAEEYLANRDTSNADFILSGIFDIDNEKGSYMYKLSNYFARTRNHKLAFEALNRCLYLLDDSIDINLKYARIFEDCGFLDSALRISNRLMSCSINDIKTNVFNIIENRRLNSLQNQEELKDEEKIDLMIKSESYDFNHHINLEICDTIGFYKNYYHSQFLGSFNLRLPLNYYCFVQKQKFPGKYKIKASFDTWNHQTEKIEKYRGRIIIERNIGSSNYSRQVIDIESDKLNEVIELEI